MKTSVFPHMVALIFGLTFPLSAQNLARIPSSSESVQQSEMLDGRSEQDFPGPLVAGRFGIPVARKARGEVREAATVYAAQDSRTLQPQASSRRSVESVVDLNVLRNPSPYQVAMRSGSKPWEISSDNLQDSLARISAIYRELGMSEKTSDCKSVALSVEQRIKLDPSKVLEIVESAVGSSPNCACEIVKGAIKASHADVPLLVAIVEASINAAPDRMRLISQCAIAAVPESLAKVQALLSKLDPNSGEDSSSGAKSAKNAKSTVVGLQEVAPNPLDLPRFHPPTPPIIPPLVTEVNPRNRR
jgi:hypothetical protein